MVALTTATMKQEVGVLGSAAKIADNNENAVSSYLEVENHLRKKARLSLEQSQQLQAQPTTTDTVSTSSCIIPADTKSDTTEITTVSSEQAVNSVPSAAGSEQKPSNAKSGRWSLDEKLLFLYGLSVFGKGRWKKISAYVPDRSLVQIKSHAQKVLKRLDTGENVFLRLEENKERLKILVAEANQRIDEEEAKANLLSPNKKKRKRASTRKPTPPYTALMGSSSSEVAPWDHIHESLRPKDTTASPTSASPVPSLTEDPSVPLATSEKEQCSASTGIPSADKMERRSSVCSVASATQSGPMEVPVAGTGAVIAAVAALCQLSASSGC